MIDLGYDDYLAEQEREEQQEEKNNELALMADLINDQRKLNEHDRDEF